MKKKIAVIGLVIFGITMFAGVLANSEWHEIWSTLSQMTIGKLFLFLAIAQISYALFTFRWQIILKKHGHEIAFWKLWLYRATGYGVSFITPTQIGGEPVRIYFLHENHGISLRESTASVLFDKLLEISSFIVFVASGVFAVSFTKLLPHSSLYIFSALIGFCLVGAAYIFKKLADGSGFLTTIFQKLGLKRIKKLQHFEEKIYRTEKLIMDFLSHPGHKRSTLPFLGAISLLAWSFTIVEYYVLARFLGIALSGFESFLVGTIPLMAYLAPIPGGLGILEGAQAGMFSLLGYSSGIALAVVLMIRFKEIFFSGIGFLYALTHGLTLLGKEKQIKQEIKAHRTLRRMSKAKNKNIDVSGVDEKSKITKLRKKNSVLVSN